MSRTPHRGAGIAKLHRHGCGDVWPRAAPLVQRPVGPFPCVACCEPVLTCTQYVVDKASTWLLNGPPLIPSMTKNFPPAHAEVACALGVGIDGPVAQVSLRGSYASMAPVTTARPFRSTTPPATKSSPCKTAADATERPVGIGLFVVQVLLAGSWTSSSRSESPVNASPLVR